MWNVLYDDMSKIDMSLGVYLVSFTDDEALVTTETEELLITKANVVLKIAADCMTLKHLKFAPTKTKGVVRQRKGKQNQIQFALINLTITPPKTMKCLGYD